MVSGRVGVGALKQNLPRNVRENLTKEEKLSALNVSLFCKQVKKNSMLVCLQGVFQTCGCPECSKLFRGCVKSHVK